MLRKLALILILEILVGVNAGVSFQIFPSRFSAALWAGLCFIAIGVFILHSLYKWNFRSKAPLFWSAVVFTFVFAIPMAVTRIITPSDEAVAHVLTIPMGYVHRASTIMFFILMGATVFEMAREIMKMRKKNPRY